MTTKIRIKYTNDLCEYMGEFEYYVKTGGFYHLPEHVVDNAKADSTMAHVRITEGSNLLRQYIFIKEGGQWKQQIGWSP